MDLLLIVNSFIFALSISGIMLVFLGNPLLVWLIRLIRGEKAVKHTINHPSVSLITIVHNAEDLIIDKIKNSLSLNYPPENYEIIIFSDGSTDRTEDKVKPLVSKNLHFFSSPNHEGKHSGINNAIQHCSGEILVFSDADAILESDAITKLVKYFVDPEVGGVCGQRIIDKGDRSKKLEKAQSDYIKFDSTMKILESQIGSISSNDGKLYAIRKDLFQPIPPAVTDDMYVCLSIVKQKYRFIFDPAAKVFVNVPSRSASHEIKRRRRIVSTSLRCIYLMRGLLNPFQYGPFPIGLFINKIIRRLLPVCLIMTFFSSMILSFHSLLIKFFFFLQTGFYLLAFSYWAFLQFIPRFNMVKRIASPAFYFCIGNYGTLLGLIDFLMGRQITKWDPVKTDK